MASFFLLERRLYRRRFSTYLLSALFLCLASVPVALLNFLGGSSDLSVSLRYSCIALFLFVPSLVCVAAQKRRQSGLEVFLRSLPVSSVSRVLSRFFAALINILLPLLVLCVYPLIFSAFGSVSFPESYLSLLGLFLLSCFLLALCQWIVSLFRSRLLSDLFAFGIPVCFCLYEVLLSYLPLGDLSGFFYLFNVPDRFFALTHGRLDLSALLFFLLGTVLFLFLSVLSEGLRSASGNRFRVRRIRFAICSLVSVLLLILLPFVSSFLPEKVLRYDLKSSDTYRISAETKDALKELDRDVEICLLSSGGVRSADPDFYSFLRAYAGLNSHLSFRLIDTSSDSDWLEKAGGAAPGDQSLIVSSELRTRVIDSAELFHYYNSELNMAFLPSEYLSCVSSYMKYSETGSMEDLNETYVQIGYYLYQYRDATSVYFDGDNLLVNAVEYVSSILPKVYVYTGSGCSIPDDVFVTYLEKAGYDMPKLSSLSGIPSDCAVLLINAPEKDLSSEETAGLSSYLSSGGKVFLTTSCLYNNQPNLYSVLSGYGLSVLERKNILCEGNSTLLYNASMPNCFYTVPAPIPESGDFTSSVAVINAHAINVEKKDGVTSRQWLYTSPLGYLRFSDDSDTSANPQNYICGVIARSGDSKLFWVSTPDLISYNGYVVSSGANLVFASVVFSGLCPSTLETIAVDSPILTSSTLTVSDFYAVLWSILIVLIFPAVFVLCSFLRKIK